MDENRGTSTPGVCGEPASYTPAYNTATRYELSYFRDAANGTVEQIPLAAYTGQTGDGVRDNGDHDTDLRWVSPGGQPSYDQPVVVPASSGSFEVDLSQDIPNMVIDPATGERTLLLEVTTISGASENGFQFWAGPAAYTATVPSAANERNLYTLNNPGSHDPAGVTIEAIGILPLNSNTDNVSIVPLATIGPEFAGQSITVTHFDMDAGSKPPVVFYMDSLAFTPDGSTDGVNENATDFAVSYGGEVDPTGRCFDGGASYNGECNNRWVSPVYTITLPSEQTCDYSNPTPETCTPFYGGQLFARMKMGNHDTHTWYVLPPERPSLDPTLGCSAFPIGIPLPVRSVLSPDDPSSAVNSWPDYFEYPLTDPMYDLFVDHQPNVPLADAQPGYLFKVFNGTAPSDFVYLAWNRCTTGLTGLTDSLAWPGTSRDYTPLPGSCPDYGSPLVAGYVEPGDPTDREMNQGDWVAHSTSAINTSDGRMTMREHVDLGRVLRLPVWQETVGSGSNAAVQIHRFGLFRLVGFNLPESWLMVEFLGWDDSCGQIASDVPMTGLSLSGPAGAETNQDVTMTAVISPNSATIPITYTWEATDIAPFTVVGAGVDGRLLNWSQPGPKTITVTAAQNQTILTATHTLTVTSPSAPQITLVPPCSNSGALVNLSVLGFNWPAGEAVDLFWDGQLVQQVTPGSDGAFMLYWMRAFLGLGDYEVLAQSGSYGATAVFSVPCTPQAPLSATIEGPPSGLVNTTYTFTAAVSPTTTILPLTYTWTIEGAAPITHTGGLSDTLQLSWTAVGQKAILLTVQNPYGLVETRLLFHVTAKASFLPLITR
ncbi:MAG: hypothetical protein H6659_10665 [Ardenticatenaceae bacterium]|nr:hypothetical protein [Ardenticatenaceae bacterium]